MTKNFNFFEYIGNDIDGIILHGLSLGIFITVGYCIYKTLKPTVDNTSGGDDSSDSSDGVSDFAPVSNVASSDNSTLKPTTTTVTNIGLNDSVYATPVNTSDFKIQKQDIFVPTIFVSELKHKLQSVKSVDEYREIYGDALVDYFLGINVGKNFDLYELGLELEQFKRLSEVTVVYILQKEAGMPIPAMFDIDIPASEGDPDSPTILTRASSTSTDSNHLIKTKVYVMDSLHLPTDIASSDEGGYSDTSSEHSLTTPPTIPTSSVESGVDSY